MMPILLQAETTTIETTIRQLGLRELVAQTPWWGWVTLLGSLLAALSVGRLLGGWLRRAAARAESNDRRARRRLLEAVNGPLQLAIFTVALSLGLSPLAAGEPLRGILLGVVRLLYILSLGWFLYGLAALVEVLARPEAGIAPAGHQVISLLRKAIRLVVVVVFVLFTADNVFGANIGAWLAGFGIAGLAVSLAAQDTIRNFFGSLTIFVDRPFAVGDRVIVDNQNGTVLEIGLRSTRLMLLGGEIVTIPNSKVVDGTVQNITRRPFIMRRIDLSLVYQTPPDKLREATAIVKEILASPGIRERFDWQNRPPRVFFNRFNPDSLNLEVLYWHIPTDWWQFSEHAERVNLLILDRFNAAGIEFAFPTQTLFLADDKQRGMRVRVESTDSATAG